MGEVRDPGWRYSGMTLYFHFLHGSNNYPSVAGFPNVPFFFSATVFALGSRTLHPIYYI